jgi:hypothetical protein
MVGERGEPTDRQWEVASRIRTNQSASCFLRGVVGKSLAPVARPARNFNEHTARICRTALWQH